jgi:hypothetical protein
LVTPVGGVDVEEVELLVKELPEVEDSEVVKEVTIDAEVPEVDPELEVGMKDVVSIDFDVDFGAAGVGVVDITDAGLALCDRGGMRMEEGSSI